jgi:hypothetical protein
MFKSKEDEKIEIKKQEPEPEAKLSESQVKHIKSVEEREK